METQEYIDCMARIIAIASYAIQDAAKHGHEGYSLTRIAQVRQLCDKAKEAVSP